MSEKQRGKMSVTQEERSRQHACTFLEHVGAIVGFPRRTIATAQSLYHRFHLFFPRKDFPYHDVALASLFVSTKLHDTLKKPRDLLAASYSVRQSARLPKSRSPMGLVEVDIDKMDPQLVENDRQKLLAIERLILETICFNFTTKTVFPYVIKLGKAIGATKDLVKFAWRIAIDSHRTLIPLEYPPNTVALASIFLASLLVTFEQPSSSSPLPSSYDCATAISNELSQHGDWEAKYFSHVEDIEAISHVMLDLFITFAQQAPPPILNQPNQTPSSLSTSPSTPSSPMPYTSPRNQYLSNASTATGSPAATAPLPITYKPDQLTRLKIALRETEHPPLRRQTAPGLTVDLKDIVGRPEGTVRYLFQPPR